MLHRLAKRQRLQLVIQHVSGKIFLLYGEAMRSSQTLEDELRHDSHSKAESGPPEPGIVLVFSNGRPEFGVIALDRGSIEIGRGEVAGLTIHDKHMSRPHAKITFDGHTWSVEDMGSRNGSAADGQEIPSFTKTEVQKIVRAGRSLFLLAADVRPFRAGVVRTGDAVMGPALQRTLAVIMRAASSGRFLLITGESGAGKELAARTYHNAGPTPTGPFVAVNAATLKPELSEAMLFGSRKGFYSGAPGGPGFVQAADKGTLFLDEVAELKESVQAQLLRALDKREVTPLGETKSQPVDFRLCSATHADLRMMKAQGKMRADLFYRIGTQSVTLPPLRERVEEIPWFIEHAVKDVDRSAQKAGVHVSFVEACLLRAWPGNVRELLAEVKNAVHRAAEDGGVLLARHLDERAGMADTLLASTNAPAVTARAPKAPAASRAAKVPRASAKDKPSDEAIMQALEATQNNKAQTARLLGMQRTQLYRWLQARGKSGQDS